jgi:hypothetical protein
MKKVKRFTPLLVFLVIFVPVAAYFFYSPKTELKTVNIIERILPPLTPTPYQFPYKNPAVPKNGSYRMVIVGDSIVGSLGLNANVLREYLISYYPDSEFVTYNYGYPSTNVLSLYQRLTEKTMNKNEESPAILKQGFEFIIIESFGYNPPSEYPLSEGLKKQEEELERSVREILKEKPDVALAFMTPIALDPVNYAKSTRDLSPAVRRAWVEERVTYINNHIKFAEERGIPVIDVYKLSLKPNGEVNSIYISDDFVHPSKKGIELISKAIADYVFTNKIFPQ